MPSEDEEEEGERRGVGEGGSRESHWHQKYIKHCLTEKDRQIQRTVSSFPDEKRKAPHGAASREHNSPFPAAGFTTSYSTERLPQNKHVMLRSTTVCSLARSLDRTETCLENSKRECRANLLSTLSALLSSSICLRFRSSLHGE